MWVISIRHGKNCNFRAEFFSILLGNWPNKRFGCIVLHMYSTGPQVQLETEDNWNAKLSLRTFLELFVPTSSLSFIIVIKRKSLKCFMMERKWMEHYDITNQLMLNIFQKENVILCTFNRVKQIHLYSPKQWKFTS